MMQVRLLRWKKMSLATRGVATAVGLGAIMIIYRLLGVDQMARVFEKKQLKDKYNYVIGNLLCIYRQK